MTKLFFGYSSEPVLSRDSLHRAVDAIAATGAVDAISWEDLSVGGRLVIKQVLSAIDSADVGVFDISTLNDNVLFEVGYAVARGKIIWLLLDVTDTKAASRWKQFRLLSSVGYVGWVNSDDIATAFLREKPHQQNSGLYDDVIEPSLNPTVDASIFYAPTFHDTDASRMIARRLNREVIRGVRLLTSDPTESALESLSWYAQKVYETSATLIHLTAPRRDLAWLHNSRSAFVAGLAAGLERPLLMLAEDEYEAPFDYQDLVYVYTNARNCNEVLDVWLDALALSPKTQRGPQRKLLATELRNLRFGEHVAENEAEALSDYFLETAAFDEVISCRNTLFIGRKGTGKTANMLQAAAELTRDSRNLVVIIKPASYELQGLLALLRKLPQEVKDYTLTSLWSFLLQSEIARTAVQIVEARPVHIPLTDPERRLLEFVDQSPFALREEFAVRFEKTVEAIEASGVIEASTVRGGRDLLHEALHSTAIRRLRSLIGPVLKGRNRVAVLIDNLDKAWDRTADLNLLSQLLLGLLSAVGRVSIDYEKEDFWRNRVRLSLATFLRSDIYAYVQRVAREPDKIPIATLEWNDRELLLRVIEERFLAARSAATTAETLWLDFFCDRVGDIDTRTYITSCVLPPMPLS